MLTQAMGLTKLSRNGPMDATTNKEAKKQVKDARKQGNGTVK
jgi:hypothetical protein